ncbi:hypothetical protein RJ639_045696 [Escallonia herrerae]|uniref:Myb/SANT-like domain-containing protein n=1 Tax=Escallonia herrerae TaxID=1293975 RepID=A0AA88W8G4_9ASTE|nr:hypothetical protein RJ639_045696 [Escallonia herrerae]
MRFRPMEIHDGPSNQVMSVRGKGKSPRKTITKDTSQPKKKDKARWDEFANIKFIELCMNQIKIGNKPGTHFNRDGWGNLVDEFNAMTGREYDKLQMKNHWDTLRRDWQNWDNLMHGESGLGWDPVRKTVDATDNWWERKIANNLNFAKFRYKNLDIYKNYYDPMFRDITATGERAYAPSQGFPPQGSGVGSVSFGIDDIGDDDTTIVGEEGDSDDVQPLVGASLEDMTTDVNTSGLQIVFPELPKRSLAISENRSNKRKKGKVSKCTSLSEQIDGMLSLLSNKNSESSDALTIKNCMQVLDKYYVVDAGYPNMKGYLAPYKGPNIRYIYLTFVEVRWAILHDMPYYDFDDQVKIVLASMAIHNYIRKKGSSDNAFDIAEQERYSPNDANGGDDNNDGGTPFTGVIVWPAVESQKMRWPSDRSQILGERRPAVESKKMRWPSDRSQILHERRLAVEKTKQSRREEKTRRRSGADGSLESA